MKNKLKKSLKKLCSYLLIYIGITILFSTAIVASYLLPDYNIRGHIAESEKQIENEWDNKPLFAGVGASLDMHTDTLMLNIAYNKGTYNNQRALEKAFENSFYENNDTALTALKTNIETDQLNNHEYSRYWHGIQVILRPLLMHFNYLEIRYILMFILIVLLGITFAMIGKQLGMKYVIALATTMCLMYIAIIPMSIQYSSIFIITLISMIAIMLMYKKEKQKYMPITFFIIGAFATYFDLLTYPLVTLGLPLILAVLLEDKLYKEKNKIVYLITYIIKLGVLWTIGYGLIFFTKWVIASIILKKDAITLAIEQLLFRVNGNEQYPVKRLEVIKKNFEIFYNPIAKYIVIGITIIWGIMFVLYRKPIKNFNILIPLLCISIVPYIWYIAFAGHSSIHCWFTYKIQAMSIFAILSAMFYTIDENQIGKFIKKIKEEK